METMDELLREFQELARREGELRAMGRTAAANTVSVSKDRVRAEVMRLEAAPETTAGGVD